MSHLPRNIRFDLRRLMCRHQVTIRQLAESMGITMKAVRTVRAQTAVDYLTYCDFTQAVTGRNVFSRWRYDAMCAQVRQIQESAR